MTEDVAWRPDAVKDSYRLPFERLTTLRAPASIQNGGVTSSGRPILALPGPARCYLCVYRAILSIRVANGRRPASTQERRMRDPNAIISTEALAAKLDDPNVRVYDCTTYNNPPPPGVDEPYIPEPGRA